MTESLPPDGFDALPDPVTDPGFTDVFCSRYGIDRTLVNSIVPLPVEEFRSSDSLLPVRITASAGRVVDAEFSARHTGETQQFGDELGLYVPTNFMLRLMNAHDEDIAARHPELTPWLTVVDIRRASPQVLFLYHRPLDQQSELPQIPSVSPNVHAYPIDDAFPNVDNEIQVAQPHEAALNISGGLGPAHPQIGEAPVPQALMYNARWDFEGTHLRIMHDCWFQARVLALTASAELADDRLRAGVMTAVYYQGELLS